MPFGPRSRDGLRERSLGLSPRYERSLYRPQCPGVSDLAGVGIVGLKAVRELVGLVDDLLKAAGHPLRYWRWAVMAWTITEP